ncbi:Autophagy- protein 2 A [Phytophthora boehmeriae]|uniref:Autophagy-related protein 2 n=1 Tax=Phytophthora boehmeriae TaxID=109152 RepID=A0A8T1WP39_9STRA|nr:Autophagy- protein 2 A [Phytophthora boehmeriae]
MSDEESGEIFNIVKRGGDYEAVPLAVPPKTVFTKLFVNFYDVIVDYAPATLSSRVILVLGKISVSSNVVTGAVMQGYKISAGDLELFLTQTRASYDEIDEVILGNDLFLRHKPNSTSKKVLKFADTYRRSSGSLDATYPSLLTFLEKFGFLQIVTMDFVDVFLRVLVPPSTSTSRGQPESNAASPSTSPEMSVELNLGTANIYACFDSFNTLLELLSVWTEQLAIEQEPRDSTAYVGLDGLADPSSVSVVTNLSPAPTSRLRAMGVPTPDALNLNSASERASIRGIRDFSNTASIHSSNGENSGVGDNSSRSINILEQIDEDAFGGGKKIFPGKTVATDTEARLLRTRLDAIQREKDRVVHGLERDDELSASDLRLRYQQEERRKSAKPIRINELVIEDYYSESQPFDEHVDESPGAFLMEPDSRGLQENTAGEDPWFTSHDADSLSGSQSSPDKAILFGEQSARWLAPDRVTNSFDEGEDAGVSEMSVDDFPLFEPVEDKPAVPLSVSPGTKESVNLEQIDLSTSEDNSDAREHEEEDDDFNANHFPMGAFPAASKNWWGMQNRLDDVELSDLQTEETESSFSHGMDFLEDKSTSEIVEVGVESACKANSNNVYPTALSMSIIDTGEDEGKEIELDFTLDSDLQSRFNRLLEMETNSSHEVDELVDDNDELEDSNDELEQGKSLEAYRQPQTELRLDVFNNEESQSLASHTVLALGDMELLDYISTSQIRKIICYWKSEATHPRESGSSMVRLQLITVRPGPNLCEEHRLKARLLPLRINLDQEVVKFLRQFVPIEEAPAPTKRSSHKQIGLMTEDDDDEVGVTMHDGAMEMTPLGGSAPVVDTIANVGAWFFQSVDIKPCKIKIDYRPNHVDYAALRAGDYLEVINLFVLEGMELVLRRVQMSGLDGWTALGEHVLISWVQDISRRQIHKCVASVSMPPLRPFVNIGAGAADLILLPMEHYGRDRRLVRGLKKGASSFLKSVTIETLNTASKVAQGTQALLEHADDVVSSSSALRRKQLKYRQAGSRIARNSRRMGGGGIRNAQDAGGGIGGRQYLAQQPASAAEGFGQAYDSLARELHVAAKTIVAVPLVEYKKTGSQGYVRSVIRAVPVAVLRPMIGASEAVAKALIGVRNAVDPELKEDIENKFKDFRAI